MRTEKKGEFHLSEEMKRRESFLSAKAKSEERGNRKERTKRRVVALFCAH